MTLGVGSGGGMAGLEERMAAVNEGEEPGAARHGKKWWYNGMVNYFYLAELLVYPRKLTLPRNCRRSTN